MLGLRLREGVSEADFADRFGVDLWARYGERCTPHVESGLMVREDGRVRLTERGWMVSNTILAELLP